MSGRDAPVTYWTHYWKNQTVENREQREPGTGGLGHTADNSFKKRGVKPGDSVYVVSVPEGKVQLIGLLVVDRILNQRQINSYFGEEVWVAADHLVAREPVAECRFDVFVPVRDLGKINFITAKGLDGIKFDQRVGANPKTVDRQTLRGIRKITADTAALFESLLR